MKVRLVHIAALVLVAGYALAERIAGDADALRVRGVEVNATSYEENAGVVVVGVTQIPPGLERELVDRSGAPIRVEVQPRGEPLGRHGQART